MRRSSGSRVFRVLVALFVAAGTFGIDQAAKNYYLHRAYRGFLGGQLGFGIFYNDGIAFSIPMPQLTILIAMLLATTFALWLSFSVLQNRSIISSVAGGLVLGGALGNAFDRVVRGAVIDYVHLFQLSVFNFADVCIGVGLGVLLLLLYRESESKNIQNKTNGTNNTNTN